MTKLRILARTKAFVKRMGMNLCVNVPKTGLEILVKRKVDQGHNITV